MPNGRELQFTDQLVVRMPAPEECLAVRKNEWAWLKRDILAMPADVPWLTTAGNLLLGVGISALFSALSLQLVAASNRPGWLLPVSWSACVVCVVLGVCFLLLARREARRATQSVGAVLEVMRTIEANAEPDREAAGVDRLRIISARYGTAMRSNDVASRLASQVVSGALDLEVNNTTMGGDPVPGTAKQLVVRYSQRGSEAEKKVDEGERLRLP